MAGTTKATGTIRTAFTNNGKHCIKGIETKNKEQLKMNPRCDFTR